MSLAQTTFDRAMRYVTLAERELRDSVRFADAEQHVTPEVQQAAYAELRAWLDRFHPHATPRAGGRR